MAMSAFMAGNFGCNRCSAALSHIYCHPASKSWLPRLDILQTNGLRFRCVKSRKSSRGRMPARFRLSKIRARRAADAPARLYQACLPGRLRRRRRQTVGRISALGARVRRPLRRPRPLQFPNFRRAACGFRADGRPNGVSRGQDGFSHRAAGRTGQLGNPSPGIIPARKSVGCGTPNSASGCISGRRRRA